MAKNTWGCPVESIVVIVPEDVPTALVGIYGFAPKIVKGNDGRVGFGFRLGNHADFQVLYEFGPQTSTRPLEPIRVRSTWSRQRARRRPFIDFLLRTGLLKEVTYKFSVLRNDDDDDVALDEPR
ncbi:uncharacterized protein LOC125491047 [Plutella xylostella]|uniref:uncharacterized protein LOC125491047 n=1 Tax=Plutella xylostella TaxID=51655 RepID=UPI0020322ED5|nr:uncharacterized protein LOC125491047 [Plutella xylostella]